MKMSKVYIFILAIIGSLFFLTLKAEATNNILFVDDDGGNLYQKEYLHTLDRGGFTYSSWNVSTDGLMSSTTLCNYNIVIWGVGWHGFSNDRANVVGPYLDNGGNLFISGWLISSNGSFCNNYLHADQISTNIPAYSEIVSNNENPISRGFEFRFYYGCGNGDMISVSTGSIPLFYIANSTSQLVGISYEDGYRVVYFTFPYEIIPENYRVNLMQRIMRWLGYYRVKIMGNIYDKSGSPLSGVDLKISGDGFGSATSDTNGFYQFKDFGDGSYTISPEKAGYKFTPHSRSYFLLSGAISGQDFVGEVITETKFEIKNNLFNPMKGESVKINYEVSTTGHGSIKIYSANGELVKTFLEGDIKAGDYVLSWNGENDENKNVASGLYFIHLKGQSSNETKKIILIK